LSAITCQTRMGLLAVTGMRVGEAIGVDRDDFDADHDGLLTARGAKFAKSRCTPARSAGCAAQAGR
jgi:integrase/recombinase XerD